MSVRVRVELEAIAQMRAAVLWWRENRPAAGNLALQELREAIALLREQPDAGAIYRRYRAGAVRRVLLPKTRNHLYWEHDADAGILTVLALLGGGAWPQAVAQGDREAMRAARVAALGGGQGRGARQELRSAFAPSQMPSHWVGVKRLQG